MKKLSVVYKQGREGDCRSKNMYYTVLLSVHLTPK